MSTTVKMLMQDFCVCEMGVFSTLQCGEVTLYVAERPYRAGGGAPGCIDGGIYQVIRSNLDPEKPKWLLVNVEDRIGIHFAEGASGYCANENLIVGTRLGCCDGAWAVWDNEEALEIMDEILDGVDSFRLYINRVGLGRLAHTNDRT